MEGAIASQRLPCSYLHLSFWNDCLALPQVAWQFQVALLIFGAFAKVRLWQILGAQDPCLASAARPRLHRDGALLVQVLWVFSLPDHHDVASRGSRVCMAGAHLAPLWGCEDSSRERAVCVCGVCCTRLQVFPQIKPPRCIAAA